MKIFVFRAIVLVLSMCDLDLWPEGHISYPKIFVLVNTSYTIVVLNKIKSHQYTKEQFAL